MATRSEDRRPEQSRDDRALDPALRSRLLQEARSPWRGLRRVLWLALAASGAIGLAAMALRASAGAEVAASDLLIQVGALGLFGTLLWRDRHPPVDPGS